MTADHDDPRTPPPGGAMAMRWRDLLFAHWPVPADALRKALPRTEPALELDTFDGAAWLGVVPFRMSGIRLRGCPPVPGTADFPETNLRTYVRAGGRSGVWFFSLDAAHRMAVRIARWRFQLPYFDAEMSCAPDGDGIAYRTRRTHRGANPGELVCRYRPTGPVFRSVPGTREDWLTNRLSLFAADRRGRLFRGDIAHAPWPLQPAAADIERNTLAGPLGFAFDDPPASLLFAREIAVAARLLTPA